MYLLENFAPSYEAKFATTCTNSFFSNSATERATKPYIETNHETLALTINLVDPAFT